MEKNMKGLVYLGPNSMRYEDVPDVSPAEGEVKIRPKGVGICGSDIHGYMGLTGRRIEPMIMGHEFAGVIEELGSGVTGLNVGDRVAVFPVGFCGVCAMCRAGDVRFCENRRFYGVLSENGAFADYISVPAKCCFKIADNVSFEVGSLMEPLAVSYQAVGRISDEGIVGKNVFIAGAGTIGLLVLACVKIRNPAKIIVSDLSDSRLEVAKQMGATHVVNPSRGNVPEKVKELTGGGVDVAFEAVGASATVQQAMSTLRHGGTAVWIGNNKPMIEVNMQEIVTRDLSIIGTYIYGYKEFGEAVELLNEGKFNLSPLISKTAPMREGPELFAKLAKDPGDWIKVVLVN